MADIQDYYTQYSTANSKNDENGDGDGGTAGGATETTLTQVRDRLPNPIASGISGVITAILGFINVLPALQYNATKPTIADGQWYGLQGDENANLKVNPGYLVLSFSGSSALEGSRVVKTSAGDLFRIKGHSTAAGFIQIHNTASVPSAGAVPRVSFAIAANQNFEEDYADLPYNFATGITVVFSSTQATYTASTDSVWFEVGYI